MEINKLTKDERSLINKRANELSRKTWEIYRRKLTEEVVRMKITGNFRPLNFAQIAALVPDIRNELAEEMP